MTAICRIALLVTLVALVNRSQAEIGFAFCDDFCKSWCEQRDPFEERIETERHDFTQSAVTVGRGIVQVEAGYTYFYKDSHGEVESSHTFPETLVRFGISEDIEFRVRYNYAWKFIKEEDDLSGPEDLRYSFKLQISRPEEEEFTLIPLSALEIRSSAPLHGDFTTERVELSLDYIYQWQVAEFVTFAGSTGFGTDGFGDFGLVPEEPAADRFIALTHSWVLGLELSEANTMYIEWFGIFSNGLEDEFVVSVFNIGIDHYVTDDFVVDVRFGMGLTEDSDDFFTGIGGGKRF